MKKKTMEKQGGGKAEQVTWKPDTHIGLGQLTEVKTAEDHDYPETDVIDWATQNMTKKNKQTKPQNPHNVLFLLFCAFHFIFFQVCLYSLQHLGHPQPHVLETAQCISIEIHKTRAQIFIEFFLLIFWHS